ncbi:MAG: 30S ribosomal protein S11 [bacterium]|nr:30S ribosomal protein S11 [bacterium]
MGKKRIIAKSEETSQKQSSNANPEGEVLGVQETHKTRKEGRIYIFSSYNNTKMSLTDPAGNVIVNVSAGAIGFKGARKSTPFAASKVAETLSTAAKNKGIDRVDILIKGIGSGRESALRSFATKGMEILSIKDITPVPHNGPRPRKVRRV